MKSDSSTNWEKLLSWIGGISIILGLAKTIVDLANPIESSWWWLPLTILLSLLTIPLFLFIYRAGFGEPKPSSIFLPGDRTSPVRHNNFARAGVGLFIVFYILVLYSIISFSYSKNIPQLYFEPARTGESLVIVAEFNDSHAKNAGFDAPNRIYSLLTTKKPENDTSFRVEKIPEIVSTQERARRILKTYNATLVIWGYYDDGGAEAFVELDKNKVISVQQDFTLATPESFSFKRVSSQTSYLVFFSLGMTYMNTETYEAAKAFLTSAIDSARASGDAAKPYPWEALMWRGNIYSWTGHFDLAISDYSEAIYLFPHREGYFNRGVVYSEKGEYTEAIADYTQATEIDPKYVAAYLNRGNAYSDQEKYTEAIADYTQATEIDPKYVAAYSNRGFVYSKQEKYTEAIADYTQAIEIDPKYVDAYLNRGNAYSDQEKYTEAIADYTQAIEIDPKYVDAYSNRGFVYSKQGKYTEAIADYTQAIEIDPKYVAAYSNRGFVYSKQGKYTEAIADYTQAIEIDPKYVAAYLKRGNAYSEQGEYTKAIADYTQAIKLSPEANTYRVRGEAYKAIKMFDQAVADVNKALEINPAFLEAYTSMGNIYADWGKYDQAISYYHKALKIQQNAYTYCVMGITFSKMGKFPEAIDSVRKGVSLDTDKLYPWCKTALEQIQMGTPVP